MADHHGHHHDMRDRIAKAGGGDHPPQVTPDGPRHVGELLRQQREALGYPLPALATNLRIRQSYLEAIEQGRWTDLPGAAYSTGFLRSYAQIVGLDPSDVLARYKLESAGYKADPELYFPEPVNESRVPGGAILLIAGLLAVLVYGGWYVLSASDRSVGDTVADLPDRLSKLIYGDQITEPEPPPIRVLDPAQVEALSTPQTATPAPPPPDTVDKAVDKAAIAADTAPSDAPPPATDTSRPNGEEESEVPQLPDLGQGAAPVAEPATPEAEPVVRPEGTPPPPPPSGEDAPPPLRSADIPPSGRVFGVAEGPVRVTLRASEDSWVEVRDGKGTLWASRVLRRGDLFRAPDVPGLVLNTGNAGGLLVTLDGRDMAPLGAKSQVLRSIDITPDALAAR
ncbi:helix-turn-helix domain-containing protein [Niveispirillum irakense]|uniref:helix-turn-helix domain-containing protein n=1 Tax=Niveispirillum irakense TaxID=34011 RepID=UPI000422F253|nr:helix-turn-helix domain-containing protein [Niveispirillum irakense]